MAAALVTALTLLALLLHGYHPYAEDGGVYMPEIKRLVDPNLYPARAGFVAGHLRFSVFAPMVAMMVRLFHSRVETMLFFLYLASLWLTLLAAYQLAARCYVTREARYGAVTLLAVWITLPIAGTSLMLMDPYVTARSLSTPCALFALLGALGYLQSSHTAERPRRRGLVLCAASLAAALAFHLLMGVYALGSVLLLFAWMTPNRMLRVWGTIGLAAASVAAAAGFVWMAPAESRTYKQIVLTRDYWFLAQWRWYEWVGVIAPLAILSYFAFRRLPEGGMARQSLARMAFTAGSIALVVASVFARPSMQTHLVARLQPLRIFQLVYIVMILVLGATLGERFLRRKLWRWIGAFALLGAAMMGAEWVTFASSNHIELPRRGSGRGANAERNAWEQAFFWISRNTPVDAVFALDAHYITQPGEDAQGFRAIAERSVLPDYSKDGGVVTNKPELAAAWLRGVQAQTGLNTEPDAFRLAALKPLGVSWVVLDSRAATDFVCGYANAVVKVCRLP